MNRKVRVLVVDDSALMRSFLKAQLSADPDIELIGCAPGAYVARELLVEHRPDVMTLDLEMPRMDGLSLLRWVMQQCPTRTLIVSGVSPAGSAAAIQALDAGAIDVIEKPSANDASGSATWGADLVCRIKEVAQARLRQNPLSEPTAAAVEKTAAYAKATLSGGSPVTRDMAEEQPAPQVIAIAASTGGTEALREVLSALPAGLPPIVIVQHMPAVFSRSFAQHLERVCHYPVREAKDGERLAVGTAMIAPGDFHLELAGIAPTPAIRLHQGPKLHGLRPAADYLFRSVARIFGERALGVILTGMGRDGAEGLVEMRRAGAFTIGQSEATCVVYGMPKAAFEAGALSRVLDLERIVSAICNRVRLTPNPLSPRAPRAPHPPQPPLPSRLRRGGEGA
jgi:two-component system chemotaxis response regulator CheB